LSDLVIGGVIGTREGRLFGLSKFAVIVAVLLEAAGTIHALARCEGLLDHQIYWKGDRKHRHV
jgi:hypothetical protein